mmetsp:Transcript_51698/g.63293  ORF Transcript_51698/g.63293 Transcript_51698/m.63293 type:complete len:98 (+) Transcript_51698:860-1153(+)
MAHDALEALFVLKQKLLKKCLPEKIPEAFHPQAVQGHPPNMPVSPSAHPQLRRQDLEGRNEELPDPEKDLHRCTAGYQLLHQCHRNKLVSPRHCHFH